jgi:DNA-binding transcriptional MerR regulator
MEKLITAKEITKKYSLSYQSLNRFTDVGLLTVVLKKGNIRYYNRQQIKKRIHQISGLMQEGYSLLLIRRKLVGI